MHDDKYIYNDYAREREDFSELSIEQREEQFAGRFFAGCLGCMMYVVGLVVLAACMCLCSCRSMKTVTVERVVHDTAYVSRLQRDSIYIETLRHDSIIERQRGDTLLIERWHTQWLDRWRDRIVRDTVYRENVRTEYRDNVITEYRDRPLSWWQSARLWLANAVLVALAGCASVWLWRKRSWWRGLLKKS